MLQLSSSRQTLRPKTLFEKTPTGSSRRTSALVSSAATAPANPPLLKILLGGIETLDYGTLTRVKESGMTLGCTFRRTGLALRGKKAVFRFPGVPLRLRPPPRARSRVHRPHPPPLRSRPQITRVRRRRRAILRHRRPAPRSRHLQPRLPGRRRPRRPPASPKKTGSAKPKSSPAAGRCASRWRNSSTAKAQPLTPRRAHQPPRPRIPQLAQLKTTSTTTPTPTSSSRTTVYFLDVTVNKTIELWNKRMHVYHGNYEKYVDAKRRARRTQLMNAYKNQRDRLPSKPSKPSSTASATRPQKPNKSSPASKN